MITAIYPGTFDPLTRGHEDLVRRAASLFDKVVVGVAHSRNKRPFFSIDERVEIAREVLGHYPNVKVASFAGLLKDFVREYPDIKLDVTLTDLQVDLIETGTDVAVRIGALADSGLIATKLAPQRRVLVVAPSYLGYGRKPPSAPEDLAGHDCLAFAL